MAPFYEGWLSSLKGRGRVKRGLCRFSSGFGLGCGHAGLARGHRAGVLVCLFPR